MFIQGYFSNLPFFMTKIYFHDMSIFYDDDIISLIRVSFCYFTESYVVCFLLLIVHAIIENLQFYEVFLLDS